MWLAALNWTVPDPARWAMNRSRAGSMARSCAETAYHDGTACQAAGPDGVTKRPRLVGRCWAAISAQLRIQVLGEGLRVDDDDGEQRADHQLSLRRSSRSATQRRGVTRWSLVRS